MTKSEAVAFAARWRLVNAREAIELQSMTVELRWQQFNAVMKLGRELGWHKMPIEGVMEVRERWARIRKACGGG